MQCTTAEIVCDFAIIIRVLIYTWYFSRARRPIKNIMCRSTNHCDGSDRSHYQIHYTVKKETTRYDYCLISKVIPQFKAKPCNKNIQYKCLNLCKCKQFYLFLCNHLSSAKLRWFQGRTLRSLSATLVWIDHSTVYAQQTRKLRSLPAKYLVLRIGLLTLFYISAQDINRNSRRML